ncbi:MAG: hypothetical protein KDA21_14455, partial [Phycisphaerales bacterium]|nr:hypothetical protein [Phycisphaerales bacterium]
LPAGVTSYTWFGGLSFFTPEDIFVASGPGSILDCGSLETVTATFGGLGSPTLRARALDFGQISFRNTTTITGGGTGANGGGPFRIERDSDGVYDFSYLETVTGNGYGVEFMLSDGAFVLPVVTTMTNVRVPLTNAVTFDVPNLVSFSERCILTLSNPLSNVITPALTNIDRSSIIVSGGVWYTLPAGVTTFTGDGGMGINEKRIVFQVSGAGSRIDASSLTTINATFGGLGGISQRFEALSGGVLDLSNVTSITGGGSGANGGGPVDILANTGSEIDLSALQTLTGVNNGARIRPEGGTIRVTTLDCIRTRIEMTNGGGLTGTSIGLDGTSAIRGAGIITGDVELAGELSPDWLISIDGDFTLTADGTYNVDLGGTDLGVDHDYVDVSGAADIGGTITAQLVNGFAVPMDALFDIVTGDPVTDTATFVDNTGAGLMHVTDVGSISLSASAAAAPDLVVSSWTVPATALVDQNFAVSFTVINQGPAVATGSWQDRLFISADDTWDGSDPQVGSWNVNGPLAGGGTYTRNLNVRMRATPGTYYLFLINDYNNTIEEFEG